MCTSQPLFTSYYMCYIHFTVIYYICKMICWPFITSHYYKILLRSALDLAEYFIFYCLWPLLDIALYSYCVWLVIFQSLFQLLEGEGSAFAVVGWCLLFLAETGIGFVCFQQFYYRYILKSSPNTFIQTGINCCLFIRVRSQPVTSVALPSTIVYSTPSSLFPST